MKIDVSKVPAEGMRHHASYDPAALDMDRFDVHLHDAFEVEAFIMKADHELVVNVDITAPLRLTCARCLAEFVHTETANALFSYAVRPTDTVDITDDVRQEIMLGYPMIPMCGADCKGLCSVCGHNLNIAACVHQSVIE